MANRRGVQASGRHHCQAIIRPWPPPLPIKAISDPLICCRNCLWACGSAASSARYSAAISAASICASPSLSQTLLKTSIHVSLSLLFFFYAPPPKSNPPPKIERPASWTCCRPPGAYRAFGFIFGAALAAARTETNLVATNFRPATVSPRHLLSAAASSFLSPHNSHCPASLPIFPFLFLS